MLFKTNSKSHKHPSIRFLSERKTQFVNQRKQKSGIQPRNRALPYRTWWGAASPILNDTPVVYTTYNRTRIRNVHTYIYIYIQTQSFWTGTKVIRKKHIVQPTGFGVNVFAMEIFACKKVKSETEFPFPLKICLDIFRWCERYLDNVGSGNGLEPSGIKTITWENTH